MACPTGEARPQQQQQQQEMEPVDAAKSQQVQQQLRHQVLKQQPLLSGRGNVQQQRQLSQGRAVMLWRQLLQLPWISLP